MYWISDYPNWIIGLLFVATFVAVTPSRCDGVRRVFLLGLRSSIAVIHIANLPKKMIPSLPEHGKMGSNYSRGSVVFLGLLGLPAFAGNMSACL
jgi:hypothetical protein